MLQISCEIGIIKIIMFTSINEKFFTIFLLIFIHCRLINPTDNYRLNYADFFFYLFKKTF